MNKMIGANYADKSHVMQRYNLSRSTVNRLIQSSELINKLISRFRYRKAGNLKNNTDELLTLFV